MNSESLFNEKIFTYVTIYRRALLIPAKSLTVKPTQQEQMINKQNITLGKLTTQGWSKDQTYYPSSCNMKSISLNDYNNNNGGVIQRNDTQRFVS